MQDVMRGHPQLVGEVFLEDVMQRGFWCTLSSRGDLRMQDVNASKGGVGAP